MCSSLLHTRLVTPERRWPGNICALPDVMHAGREHFLIGWMRNCLMSHKQRIKGCIQWGALFALMIGCSGGAFAEEPPLSVPKAAQLGNADGAIDFNGWLLYPAVGVFSVLTNNLYQSPVNPLSVAGIGMAPSLVAEWTNGIHHTTLYGNADLRDYSDTSANTYDGQAGFVQKYEAMRDLIFTVQGDYTHKTNTSVLLNSIPGAIGTPAPGGTIVTTNGQQTVNVSGPIVANPYNMFTALASVFKILNQAFVRLTGSVSRTEYDNQTPLYPDFTVKTFNGSGGFWLNPLFYVYSDGSLANTTYSASSPILGGSNSPVSAYRAVAGVGSAQIGLFGGALYFGHQGSDGSTSAVGGSTTTGGNVFGGRLSYYPTRYWTWSLSADETINIASQPSVSNLALNIATQSPLLVPLGESTRTTSVNLQSDYIVSQQLAVTTRFGYTRVEYLDIARLDEAWLAYAALKYQLWRNVMLSLDYQYSKIVSTAALQSSTRNYATAGAVYKF